jgi:hypothetical protein
MLETKKWLKGRTELCAKRFVMGVAVGGEEKRQTTFFRSDVQALYGTVLANICSLMTANVLRIKFEMTLTPFADGCL